MLLALAIEALVVLLLLFLVPPEPGRKNASSPSIFSIDTASDEPADEEAAKPDKARPAERTARKPAVPPPVTPPPPTPPPTPRGELPFIVMTREEVRAAQIANMKSSPSEPAAAPAASSGSSHSDDTPIVGKGPNGEPLYAAEWYRRPRQAELETYLPRSWARGGSGLIACRTVARYHVEDCKILGESPRGSGYGYAVQRAAFQFLVRPPRVGGKELVGTWVSIRIDYTVTVK